MKIRTVCLILTAALLIACASGPGRYLYGNEFVSRADPAMRVRIDPAFEYLGPEDFMLGDSHEVQRHHFVRLDGSEVTAMVVLQFEGIVDGVPGEYEFNIPSGKYIAGGNYRFAPLPVRLGSHDYVHNTWAFNTRESAREEPGKESDRTLRLLDSLGYRIDDELIMARYVRAVGPERRKEIIFFYMEPLSRSGHTLAQFPDGGPASEVYDRLSEAVVERSRAAFEILPD